VGTCLSAPDPQEKRFAAYIEGLANAAGYEGRRAPLNRIGGSGLETFVELVPHPRRWHFLSTTNPTNCDCLIPAPTLGTAASYTLALRWKLTRFLEHPDLELGNDMAENSMRPDAS